MAEIIIDKPINDIISESFIDYAKEVIEDRALPDTRDGLKPVQRRVIYAMYELGLTPDKEYRKCARIVGDVLGKYHPHGDQSVYGALTKLAQAFSKRYVLVDGHGNFGTIDDSPAAMRYTEAKMSVFSMLMLKDIDKGTVDWESNFDDTELEPAVLPSMFPNLIVNGSYGIAVGMACDIPPHNLGETIDGIIAYLKNPKITTKGLMEYIKGPDFPTGGIVAPKNLLKCYEEGIGAIVIRSRVMIEELPDNKRQLVITEIPYQVSKIVLLSKIAKCIERRNVDDVVEIRDESDISGCRIVIEMNKGGDAELLLKELYEKKTDLQKNYNYSMVALVDGKPRTLSLRNLVSEFVNHKIEVIKKRTKYDLNKAKDRLHIVEGLIKAVENIDAVITTIKKSKSPKEAKKNLIKQFAFSTIQAQAILELRLQGLTALQIKTLKAELKELIKTIKSLETILSSEKNILKEIEKELLTMKEKYADSRKTIIKEFDEIEVTAKIEKFTLQINENGKIKKLSKNYNGNKGITLKTDTTKNIYLFDEKGNFLKYNGLVFPQSINTSILNICNEDDIKDNEDVIFITTDGQIKKSAFSEYKNIKTNCQAIKLNKFAKVISVFIGNNNNKDILILTKSGMAIKFLHKDIRQIGRIAAGVRAVALEDKDEVVGAIMIELKEKKLIQLDTDTGAEKLEVSKLKEQKRGGKGVKIIKNSKINRIVEIQ